MRVISVLLLLVLLAALLIGGTPMAAQTATAVNLREPASAQQAAGRLSLVRHALCCLHACKGRTP